MGQTWNGDLLHDAGNVVSDIGGFFSGPPGDPGRIRQVASQIQALRDQFDSDRRGLDEAVDELARTWRGDGATAFATTWYDGARAPAQVLNEVTSKLDGFVRQLRDYADQLEHAQHEHWIQLGIMAALTVVNIAQLGLDPATDAAEVGAGTAMAVGSSFALADVGTFAIQGAVMGFGSDVIAQLGADVWDHLDSQFDQTGDHAVGLFNGQELALSTVGGGLSFAAAGGAATVTGRYGGELLSRALANPLSRPATVGAFSAATDAAGQLITSGHVDAGEVAVSAGAGALESGLVRGPAGSASPAAAEPRPPEQPTAYSVAFEMQLDPKDLGSSRSVHFNRANAALEAALRSDPSFSAQMEELIPGAGDAVRAEGRRTTPDDWIWHHTPTDSVDGRVGVMHLVPEEQHTPGSAFWKLMHPGGFGGYAEWAVPNGAPANR